MIMINRYWNYVTTRVSDMLWTRGTYEQSFYVYNFYIPDSTHSAINCHNKCVAILSAVAFQWAPG